MAVDSRNVSHIEQLYRQQVQLLGNSVVSASANRGGLRVEIAMLLEEAFIGLALALEPDVSVEIGAHEASFSERIKAARPEIEAIAFEANPTVFKFHAQRLRAPEIGVDYRHCAICSMDGPVELIVPVCRNGVPVDSSLSSIMTRANREFECETVLVPGASLDNALGDRRLRQPVAWIDVEGAQKQTLMGGQAFFGNVTAVYIELENVEVWKAQSTEVDVQALLAQSALIPIMRDSIARKQFNEVYIRSDNNWLESAIPIVTSYVEELRSMIP